MGTRSAIGVMHGDVCKAIYCHYDGYPEHNGRILLDHYTSERANALVSHGNMSILGKEIYPEDDLPVHSFGNRQADVCVFYNRDRGDYNETWQVCTSFEDMLDQFSHCQFFYVMQDGVWYVSDGGDPLELLSAVLAALEETK
jgi:hypothetical protein